MTDRNENSWWYEDHGKQEGPIGFDEMRRLIQVGKVEAGTLVWSTGMQEWNRAKTVPNLRDIFASVPPPIPNTSTLQAPVDSVEVEPVESSVNVVQRELVAPPWPRFFARIFDMWLESLPAGFLLGVILYAIDAEMADQIFSNTAAAGILALPIVMVIDGILVGLFGNSLGKAILGIKVVSNSQNRFTAGLAIKRNIGVWFRGLAIGFPIINLFTMGAAYKTLSKGLKLDWDIAANVRVIWFGAGPWRYSLFVLAFSLLLILNFVLLVEGI